MMRSLILFPCFVCVILLMVSCEKASDDADGVKPDISLCTTINAYEKIADGKVVVTQTEIKCFDSEEAKAKAIADNQAKRAEVEKGPVGTSGGTDAGEYCTDEKTYIKLQGTVVIKDSERKCFDTAAEMQAVIDANKANKAAVEKSDVEGVSVSNYDPSNLDDFDAFGNFKGDIALLQLMYISPLSSAVTWKDGRVNELDLGSLGLSKVPKSVFKLATLERLDLARNAQLTILPDEIGKLTNLTSLDLSNTKLTILPDEIGKLTNLTYLLFER